MKLHLIGDSLFARREGCPEAMVCHLLKEKKPDLDIYNSAVSGYNTYDLLAELPKILQVDSCDYLFILIGANDLALHKQVSLADFKTNLEELTLAFAEGYEPEQLVLLTPLPVDEEKQVYRHNGLVEIYGQVVKDLCQERGYTCLDSYALFLEKAETVGLSELLEGALDDGLHFGRLGYDVLTDGMLTVI